MTETMGGPGGFASFWSDSKLFWNFIVVFAAIYAFSFFVIFRNWRGRPHYDASSCGISMVHGTIAAIWAASDIITTSRWQLDAPNTFRQVQIMEFSMAYFFVDLLNYLYAARDDFLFIGHHIATFTYMFSCRYYTYHGATSVMWLIAFGESTSPIQNIWTVARLARAESPVAKQVYTSLSPFFTVYFTLVRGIFGPYLVWTIGKFYVGGSADAVVPRWLAYSWTFKIVFAVFGSIIWVYKLWMGLIKFYRGRNAAAQSAWGEASGSDSGPRKED